MTEIVVFTQNNILRSILDLSNKKIGLSDVVFLTTQKLFPNEEKMILGKFPNSKFVYFAQLLSDRENEECDHYARIKEKYNLNDYIAWVKRLKNEKICKKILELYPNSKGYVCSDELGVDEKVWVKNGFIKVECEKYDNSIISVKSKIKNRIKKCGIVASIYEKIKVRKYLMDNVYVSSYKGKKIVFIGRMHRIAYRTDLKWEKSSDELKRILKHKFYPKSEGQYITTLHESYRTNGSGLHESRDVDLIYCQDGYLPPNDSCEYLKFNPTSVRYYSWDYIGMNLFKNNELPVSIMPYRKKLFLPKIKDRLNIKNVLIASSAPGDWTAQKNRSDEDLFLMAIVKLAMLFPDINFIYRCHPTWIYPSHNGVNSINRAAQYFSSTGLKNVSISSNIPIEKDIATFERSSLEDDLKSADIVLGEHSISMIDAALQGIPFISVNLTNRRNLFIDITKLGFPHCESVEDLICYFSNIDSSDFIEKYNIAVDNYNEMTTIDE